MLTLIVEEQEFFNEETSEFVIREGVVLELEHSLAALSKWEAKFGKPFLNTEKKTDEEVKTYIEMMLVTPGVSSEIVSLFSKKHYDAVSEYISSSQSATTFYEPPNQKAKKSPETITSELIYFWMTSYSVPFECENWNLNRLFALLRICGIKNSNEKQMSKSEIAARNRELNAARKAKLGTSG